MNLPALQPDLMTVTLFGAGASVLGLAGLVVRARGKGRGLAGVVAAGLVAVAAAGAGLAGLEQSVWLPLLGLAVLTLACRGLRHPAAATALGRGLRLVQSSRVQSAALLLLGPLLVGWQCYQLDRATEIQEDMPLPRLQQSKMDADCLERVTDRWAVTDAGNPVPLYTLPASVTEVQAEEAQYLQATQMAERLIRTADAGPETNCHGWVFAGGHGWVRGDDVDGILRDNGYHTVSQPQAGDVAIYREADGKVAHTGLVRGVTEEGFVLVESKWGRLGRFIHGSEQHCYPNTVCTFYHSGRGGHVLRGLPGSRERSDGPTAPTAARAQSRVG